MNPRAEKTPSPDSKSNLMECFQDAINNSMHMVDSLSSDEILSRSSKNKIQLKNISKQKLRKRLIKRPLPVQESHQYNKLNPENLSFNDLQISQGQNHVNFNGSNNDLMSPIDSLLLDSAHFK